MEASPTRAMNKTFNFTIPILEKSKLSNDFCNPKKRKNE